jgi:hypothetical protein
LTRDAGHAALTDNRHKLHRLGDKFELYDLVDDPNETRDIAGQQADVFKRMRAALEAWQDSVIRSNRGEDYPGK